MHTHFQIFNMLPINICIPITKHIKICSAYFSPLSSTKTIKQLKSEIRELKLKSLPISCQTFCTTNQLFFFTLASLILAYFVSFSHQTHKSSLKLLFYLGLVFKTFSFLLLLNLQAQLSIWKKQVPILLWVLCGQIKHRNLLKSKSF